MFVWAFEQLTIAFDSVYQWFTQLLDITGSYASIVSLVFIILVMGYFMRPLIYAGSDRVRRDAMRINREEYVPKPRTVYHYHTVKHKNYK